MPQHLYPAWVNQVEVTNLVGRRRRIIGDELIAARKSSEPAQLQGVSIVVEDSLYA